MNDFNAFETMKNRKHICTKKIFDKENEIANTAIWKQYGSELAADFGTKFCGKPAVRGNRCEEHLIERRSGKDRRSLAPKCCGADMWFSKGLTWQCVNPVCKNYQKPEGGAKDCSYPSEG